MIQLFRQASDKQKEEYDFEDNPEGIYTRRNLVDKITNRLSFTKIVSPTLSSVLCPCFFKGKSKAQARSFLAKSWQKMQQELDIVKFVHR